MTKSPRKQLRMTVLRLLPAAFVGLLPFQLLDNALLENLYRVRGPRPGPDALRVVIIADAADYAKLANELIDSPQVRCLNFTRFSVSATPCLALPIETKVTTSQIRDEAERIAHFLSIRNPFVGAEDAPAYRGRLNHFKPVSSDEALASGRRFLEDAEVVAFVPATLAPSLPLPTPAGTMDQTEVALNVLASVMEGKTVRPAGRMTQFGLATIGAGAAAWILFTYPILLALIFSLLFGVLHFVLAMVAFDAFGWQLSVVAPLFAILAVYLIGLSDRLDRREREEWSLEQQAEALRQLDEMRNNFLSLISHDLKTPLARIQTLLERFKAGDFGVPTPQQQEALGRIVNANGHLQRTISTLLLLSRIESRDFRIRPQPTDLTELLESSVKHHLTAAMERDIRIVTEFEPLFLVDVDRALLAEVVNNLLDNALKYSPPGSALSIRCGDQENCPELSPPQPGVWLEIQDQGPGIPPEDRARVLQKFMRGSNELTAADQSVKGTGLGLYLSVFFVEKHLGHLGLVSRVRGESIAPGAPAAQYFAENETGTCVRVTLPMEANFPPSEDVDAAPPTQG